MKGLTLTLVVSLLLAYCATAQDAVVIAPEPVPAVPITVAGFVDTYYQLGLTDEVRFPTSFTDRMNEFALGMANVVFSREGKVGFVADLAFGPRAEAANGDFPAIKQLYVTYSPMDAMTLTAGNFGTFVGYELIDAPGNVNYSTSYLFSNGPFFHTGLKADFVLNDKFGAMLGVFNDTDGKLDAVAGKHLGAQVSTALGGLSAYVNVLVGKSAEDPEGQRALDQTDFQIDLTATYTISESFMLGLNVSDKQQRIDGNSSGGFSGAAVYASITPTPAFGLGLRGEYFTTKLPDGSPTPAPSVVALTASGNITVGALRLIPEIRLDSGRNGFTFSDEAGSLTRDRAASFILAAVYSF